MMATDRKATVKNVVFDVGRVLIDFNYDDLFALLSRHGAEISTEADFVTRVGLLEYEQGQLSSTCFLARLQGLLRQPLPEEELQAAWIGLFSPVPAMLELASELKSVCGVFLLSNTSELHWQHLQSAYALNACCHDLLASYEIGALKPEPAIYRTVEKRFGLVPATTLFIDDRQDNVAGAQACGWQGHWHRDRKETIVKLKQLSGLYD